MAGMVETGSDVGTIRKIAPQGRIDLPDIDGGAGPEFGCGRADAIGDRPIGRSKFEAR